MEYVKSFLALFLLMTLLLYLVPGERLKKYIHFFVEIVLTVGILSPVISLVFDSDEFLEKIEYETFTENLSEIARDMERMEYIQNDYYLEKYETAIGEDAKQMTQPVAEKYGYAVGEVKVQMTENYTLDAITLLVKKPAEEIAVEEITFLEDTAEDYVKHGKNGMTGEIKQKLADYYQIDKKMITVQYE